MDWRQKRALTGVRYLLETAQAQGVSCESCLIGSAISTNALQDSDGQIEAWQELAVIRNLLEQTGRPGLGFITGQRYHLTSLGVLGFTMLASRTLIEAFATFSRFQLMALTLCPTQLVHDRRGMWLLFDASVLPRDARAFIIERGLAACLQITCELLQRPANPLAVGMTARNAMALKALQSMVVQPPSVSTSHDGILFSNQELNATLPQAHINAQLQGEALCERQYLETVNPLIEAPTGRLVQSILIRYSDQLLSCRTVAERLGLSERTLQRRLATEGRGFQQLNDQIKKQLAERLLSNSRVGIQTIAQNLGYAEAASFSRAFSRWTGKAPGHWQSPETEGLPGDSGPVRGKRPKQ